MNSKIVPSSWFLMKVQLASFMGPTWGPPGSCRPQLEALIRSVSNAHGFVVLCFVVVMQSFIMNSHEIFIHIHQGCFAGIGAIVRLPQCQWSKPDGYGKIIQCITTTKHSKAKTVCIFLGIYCISNCEKKWIVSCWYQFKWHPQYLFLVSRWRYPNVLMFLFVLSKTFLS